MRRKSKKILSLMITFTMFICLFIGISRTTRAAQVNIALNKVATASSYLGGNIPAAAFDSNTNTRYESAFSDPQWISVDLGASYNVTGVKLNWETAAGKDYKIQVSVDNVSWQDAYTKTGGTGGVEDITFSSSKTGRYVRMYGTARTTGYGYSLWEFEVYGTAVNPDTNINVALNKSATASSYQGGNTATLAFDSDNANTRWESASSDPQWVSVDLGSSYTVTGVKLIWETAAGKDYKIQVSVDNVSWQDAYTKTGGTGGTENITFSDAKIGRYVRMYGTARTTGYGYSLWGFEVYGTGSTNVSKVALPSITPPTGSYTSSQSVSITDSTQGATIRYTTDGSNPTSSTGSIYSVPFTVSATTTVKAIAYKAGMSDSDISSSTITIGNSALSAPTGLTVTGTTNTSVSLVWSKVTGADRYNVYRSFSGSGPFTKVNTSAVTTNSYTDSKLDNATYYYKVSAINSTGESALSSVVQAATSIDFGPNVIIFDPSMSAADVQNTCTNIFTKQESNQFGTDRYALLFKPGSYNAVVRVGFYTQVAGLGQRPDDVNVSGGIGVDAGWMAGNATCNFWRSCENISITPSTGETKWAVSQAAPLRRVHIKGNLSLFDGGWSSGGFLSDSLIDGIVIPGSQQQWFSRNDKWARWDGGVWNMVFTGVTNAPSGTWPANPITVVNQTPVVREKPFLTIDSSGKYSVFVPALQTNSQGITWANGQSQGQYLAMDQFYIAHPETSTAASINAALSQGKNLIFTPGIYHINDTLRVTNPNTVILGLGYATIQPDNGVVAMSVADVDGVNISGLLFDAGAVSSPLLMEVGEAGSAKDHSANPTSLSDLFFRVGGAGVGKADTCLKINSNNVIGDDFWIWRADHGAGVGWTSNTATNGLIVNGNNVTIYALMVEHFLKYQTIWNGNGGRTYFYQSEIPYDVPDQASWMSGSTKGYASYKVADTVTSHEAYGLGVYSYFLNPNIVLNSAIEVPNNANVKVRDACSVYLAGYGEITHIVNNTGATANSASYRQTLTQYP
ncbi:discoidin domain-containing protein [Clostridium sp. YIM B02505]|uniref:Discoidin domain-containing protein n=1 Tax=Clostridium yunnanense TaxID=2800325 RepID=A0ABS1EUI3_9CLOT|nr:discoidin domain-containing protein [Clostridium yunnanense]MBK1813051.1 discoidin domain-containing protein [Clostridium yunnanense]